MPNYEVHDDQCIAIIERCPYDTDEVMNVLVFKDIEEGKEHAKAMMNLGTKFEMQAWNITAPGNLLQAAKA